MSKRSDRELLLDIVESIDKIFRYTDGMSFKNFIEDERTIDAVVRNFEIIGEAANRLDESFQDQFPHVEWRRIIGLRHRIVHDYFGIDYHIIWQILETKLNDFRQQIEKIISQL
ncbi:MAG: DUF86 domain-containing protein [Saprospiraceae bacterium]|nr:DUF86 domain-containing protein [Saprospiraceae bacterium]